MTMMFGVDAAFAETRRAVKRSEKREADHEVSWSFRRRESRCVWWSGFLGGVGRIELRFRLDDAPTFRGSLGSASL